MKKHNYTKKESLNKSVITDYEMNERVANNIIEIIESGNVEEWKKGWRLPCKKGCEGMFDIMVSLYEDVVEGLTAVNVYSLKEYNWLNGNPIPSGFYVSFKDIKAHKLTLKKGSKGEPTYKYAKFEKKLTEEQKEGLEKARLINEELDKTIQDLISGESQVAYIKFNYYSENKGKSVEFYEQVECDKESKELKYSRVQYVLEYQFNINDLVDELDVKKLWDIKEEPKEREVIEGKNNRIKIAEEVKDDYINRAKVKYNEVLQGKAYYTPSKHSVVMPKLDQFENSNLFYATLFHELAHSTGHETLLNRKGIMSSHSWGDSTYAKEELVAELSSLYTTRTLNIATDETYKRTIAYLKSWGEGLKNGIKHNILNTIFYSQKASELILNIK